MKDILENRKEFLGLVKLISKIEIIWKEFTYNEKILDLKVKTYNFLVLIICI